MRIALIGDAASPHLLKWGRTLVRAPDVELWVASSRGFAPGWDGLVAPAQRLALDTRPDPAGGNVGVLLQLPRLARWLAEVDPDWLHAHYLTSHGTLAWLARRLWRLRGQLVVSAWGSDILVAPQRSVLHRLLVRRVLRASRLATSDSAPMAQRMHALGAVEVMTFPFGLDSLPAVSAAKQPGLCFANRALEPNYRPDRVLALFAQVAASDPAARLVIANDGTLAAGLAQQARHLGLRFGRLDEGAQVEAVGRLDAAAQAGFYARAPWFLSLPESDSVSVSVLEAMAHGCLPIVSDLPANRELVRDGENGLIVGTPPDPSLADAMNTLAARADTVAAANRRWVAEHAMFPPAVERFLARLRELMPAPPPA